MLGHRKPSADIIRSSWRYSNNRCQIRAMSKHIVVAARKVSHCNENFSHDRAGFVSSVGLSEVAGISLLVAIMLVLLTYFIPRSDSTENGVNSPVMGIHFAGAGNEVWIQNGTSEIHTFDLGISEGKIQFDVGTKVLTKFAVSADGRIQLVEIDSCQIFCIRDGAPIVEREFPIGRPLISELSADGHSLVVVSDRNRMHTWNLEAEFPICVESDLEISADKLTIAPSGKTIYVSTVNSGLMVIDVESKAPPKELDPRKSMARSLSISGDGRWLLAVFAQELWLYEPDSHDRSLILSKPGRDEFLTGKISPDGRWIAVSSQISGLQLISCEESGVIHRLPQNTLSHRYAFDNNSNIFLTGDAKGILRTWVLSEETSFPRKGSEFVFTGQSPNVNGERAVPATRI
jgi:tricorn protease-like protein